MSESLVSTDYFNYWATIQPLTFDAAGQYYCLVGTLDVPDFIPSNTIELDFEPGLTSPAPPPVTGTPPSYVEVEFTSNETALDFRPFQVLCSIQNYTISTNSWVIYVDFIYLKKDGILAFIGNYRVDR